MELLTQTWKLTAPNEWKILMFLNHVRFCLERYTTEEGMKEYYTLKELSNYLDMDIKNISKYVTTLESKGIIQVVEDINKTTKIVLVKLQNG